MRNVFLILFCSYINIQYVPAQDTIFEDVSFKLKELTLIDSILFKKIDVLTSKGEYSLFKDKTEDILSITMKKNKCDSIVIFISKIRNPTQTSEDIGFLEIEGKISIIRGSYISDIFRRSNHKTKIFHYRKIVGTKYKDGILPLIADDIDRDKEWIFLYFKGNIKSLN